MLQNNSDKSQLIWCAVPVFNNKDTVRDVVAGCQSVIKNVVVIDDGSTDADVLSLLSDIDVVVLRHEKNNGKGDAIRTASKYIEARSGFYMITIDADGQHNPADIEKFIPLLDENDPSIIIGCRNFNTENIPKKSRFGRKFANFWLRVETGIYIDDCQSGFRAYPVRYLNQIKFKGSHYDFEAEVLAKAVWAGLTLKTVAIDVLYPESENRVSSFKPFLDNLRISLIHSMLIGRSLVPLRHKKLVKQKKHDLKILRHPGKFLMMLLKENATPEGLAMSAAVGTFLAVLPLLFVHTVVILYVATRLNLNKIVAVNVQHFFMPPFVPVLCIEVGYYIRNGHWLTDVSFTTIFSQFSDRLIEWLLGSLIIAPIGAVLMGIIIFFSATLVKRQTTANGSKKTAVKKRGNTLGFWFFRLSLRIFGLSGAYGLLYPVCLYYLIFDRTAVSVSMAYIKRRFKTYNRFQRIRSVYRLFINQGKNLIDRYYVVSGLGQFDIELRGYDRIENLLTNSQKGVILLTAHVGNWQVTMTALERSGKTVYLLKSPEENIAVRDSLNINSESEKVRIISPENFLGGVIEIMKAINQGDIVSIMGDRSYGRDTVKVHFMGERAYFPHSAFTIAAAANCPVIILLSAKVATKKYLVDASHVIEPRYSSKDKKQDELKDYVQEFARILEDYTVKYPFQWFIFHDIWEGEKRIRGN